MVGLQAMVLGRLGRKPSPHPRACALSCPSPFTGRGILRGSGLYNGCIVGRVVVGHPPTTRPSLCPLQPLRRIVDGATMTTPGGTGTTLRNTLSHAPCSAHRLLSWGRSSHDAPGLRLFARPRPDSLCTYHQ